MKIKILLTLTFASALLLGLAACTKQEVKDNTDKAVDATKNAADKTATAIKDTTEKAIEATKDAAKKTGEVVSDAAKKTGDAFKSATSSASSETTAALENAKKLVAEGNWQEATKALDSLANMKLTPEQQSQLDQLKKQIAQLQAGSKKVVDDVTKAVGDLQKK